MYNDDFLYCRSANVPGSSNMAAGGNRRLQQTQHQVDEVKVWSDSSVILFLQETYVIRRDNFAKAVSPSLHEGEAERSSQCPNISCSLGA